MNFEIDESYITDVTIYREWGMYDHVDPSELTPEQIFKILRGEDRCSSTSSDDHPEFKKLRKQLASEGYIRMGGGWNSDMVLKPFTLNGISFEKDTRFFCAAALNVKIATDRKYGRLRSSSTQSTQNVQSASS